MLTDCPISFKVLRRFITSVWATFMIRIFSGVLVLLCLSCLAVAAQAGAANLRVTSQRPSLKEEHRVSKGLFKLDIQWTTAQQTAGDIDVLAGRVSFHPNQVSSGKECGAISFIQTARVLDNKGKDFTWPSGEAARNQIRTRTNIPGFFIDHDALNCAQKNKTCSAFYRDSWPNTDDGSQDGQWDGETSEPAILIDYPFGWDVISEIFLEACAMCRNSRETLGCVTWGGKWPTTGAQTLHQTLATDSQSNTFIEALRRFETHYKSHGP